MLAYAAAEDKHGSSSGCLWLILIFKAILVAALLVSSSIDSDLSISEALRRFNLLDGRDRRSISAAFSGTMDFCKADRQEFHDN